MSEMKKYFVTGIGTNVGKSIVSAVITEALKADYWKPVQSGYEDGTDTETLNKLVSNTSSVFHPESYLLKAPLSPHAAAQLENFEIDLAKINLPITNKTLIIEGAGGLMVPLNNTDFVFDLITKFDAEVILVVKHYLGSINHTLLSIELLKSRNIAVKGIIINGEANAASEEIIFKNINWPLLGRVNQLHVLNKEEIKQQAKQFENKLL
jgi:dethiobiotin synthetase